MDERSNGFSLRLLALALCLAVPAQAGWPAGWLDAGSLYTPPRVRATLCNRVFNALGGGDKPQTGSHLANEGLVNQEDVTRGKIRAAVGLVLALGAGGAWWGLGGKATPTPTAAPAAHRETAHANAPFPVPAPKPVPFTAAFALNPLDGTNGYSGPGDLLLTMLPKLSKDSQNEATRLFATDALARAGKPDAITADDVASKVETFLNRQPNYHTPHLSVLLDSDTPVATQKVVASLVKALDTRNKQAMAPKLDIYLAGKQGRAVMRTIQKEFRGGEDPLTVDLGDTHARYRHVLSVRYVNEDGETVIWRTVRRRTEP